MNQPRKYKQIHPSKQSQAAKALEDYEAGNYENRNAVGSVGYEEYHAAYHDLVANEPIEEQIA